MKKNFTHLMIGLGIAGTAMAQTTVTGPSSSQSSYLEPLVPSATITSILTATDVIGGYTMCGIPDGLGAYDNNDGTFTLLMNHEFGAAAGGVRAHGSSGAFVSKWIINKSTLAVVSGADLIQNVNVWNGTGYTTYNATSPSTLAAFGRFCSADLPAVSAFYNSATGKGTKERIFMNGEETGNNGRALAHIATGPEAGYTYELPYLGKASWENYVACPFPSDKTIVIGMDDTTPGQVYVYVGTKTNSGDDITRAGLTGGKLYGVAVLGLINEVNGSVPAPGTMFNMIDLGAVHNMNGSTINTISNNMGVTNFLRPEDGAWDPSNPRDFYFVTTNSFNSPSRLWRMRFNDLQKPELGGTIEAVLDGTEGHRMLDNLGFDHFGHIMLVEDVGGNAHNGKVWQYDLATDALTLFAQHDVNRFISGGSNFLTQDEEASGIIDVQEILGPGMFLCVTQAHYGIPAPVVEGGQLMALYNPLTAASNPSISVLGNNVSIPNGNTSVTISNNTDFGAVNLNTSIIRPFTIRNAGPGVLSVKSLSIGGVNAGDFALVSSPLPATVAVNGAITVHIQFTPPLQGTRHGEILINNNDFQNGAYSYAIQGVGAAPEINLEGNSISIVNGNTLVSTADNTDFGSVVNNTPVSKTFDIRNTGTGTLTISQIAIQGNNSSMFSFVSLPALPLSLSANGSQAFTIEYLPVNPGTNTAIVTILSNDADESTYSFIIEGNSMSTVGIEAHSASHAAVNLYPNPTKDEAILRLNMEHSGPVSVTVVDIQGKVVLKNTGRSLTAGENEISIDTSSLKSGEYFVKVQGNNLSHTIKMVVIH